MKAVISAVGKDHPGILAFITRETAEHNANILDITQNLTQGLFTMIMVVEFPGGRPVLQQVRRGFRARRPREGAGDPRHA
jgi:ACT domain-containing protein